MQRGDHPTSPDRTTESHSHHGPLDHIDTPVTEFAPDGTCRYANRAAVEHLGLPLDAVVGHHMSDVFPPEIAAVQMRHIRQVIETGQGETYNAPTVIKGAPAWYRTTLTPVRGDDDTITSVLAFATYMSPLSDTQSDLEVLTETLRAHVSKRNQEVQRLYDASRQISRTLDLPNIYATVHELIQANMSCDGMYISSFDAETELIHCVSAWHEGNPLDVSGFPAIPLEPEGMGTQSVVIRSGEPMYIPDAVERFKQTQTVHYVNGDGALHDDVPPEEENITRSILLMPLKLAGRVTGVLQILSYQPDVYTADDKRFLEALANIVTVAQNNAQLYQRADQELAERRQVEQALRESEARYRLLSETARDVILTHDMQGRITYMNQAGLDLGGYSEEDFATLTIHDLVPPDTHAAIEQRSELRRGGMHGRLVYEMIFLGKDGQQTPFEVSSTPLVDSDDTLPKEMLLVCRDITDRQRAQAAIAHAEAQLRNFLESLEELAYFQHVDGSISMMNSVNAEITGYALEDLADPAVWRTIIHPDDLARVEQFNVRYPEGTDRLETEYRLRDKDGRWRWFHSRMVGVRDSRGQFIGYNCIDRDVTARKEMEAAIRESEERFRLFFEMGTIGMAITSPEKGWLRVNDQLCAILGYSREDLLQTTWDAITYPEDMAANLYLFHEIMAGKRDSYQLEKRFIRPDGRIVHTIIGVTGVRDDAGEVRYLVSTVQDITRRVHAEQQLAAKLEELARSNDELEKFAYVASHDLQEPLRMVTSYLQLLERRYRDALDDKADMYIHYAVEGAARMKDLISGLLAYSRVGTRGQPFETVSSRQVISHVLDNLQPLIAESQAVIQADRLPDVVGDRIQLEQLFQNLLVNAIKFRSDAPPRITIGVERDGERWQFAVRDNGIGIDPAYNQRIFVIFQRLHHRRDYDGTGIGLAICKKIVERHNGAIWVESRPGDGATFFFTLPAAEGNEHGKAD